MPHHTIAAIRTVENSISVLQILLLVFFFFFVLSFFIQEGKRQSDTPALWWIDGDGNEVKWSFQDVALKSKRLDFPFCLYGVGACNLKSTITAIENI